MLMSVISFIYWSLLCILLVISAGTIRSTFDTDLADTIRIRYDTHVHDLTFQNQEFLDFNKKWMFWADQYKESNKY